MATECSYRSTRSRRAKRERRTATAAAFSACSDWLQASTGSQWAGNRRWWWCMPGASPFAIRCDSRAPVRICAMSDLDPSVQRELDALSIPHEVLECNPEWADTDVFCANYGIPRENAANTILVAAKTEPRQ